MIFVPRTAEPSALSKNGTKWRTGLLAAIKSANKAQIKKLKGKYAHKEVKSRLRQMFEDKCAYCESSIGVVSYGHIEHFRPKGRYPKLTFSWNNLLLSCDICNDQNHKGEKFPTRSSGGPLLDPTKDDPTDHLNFRYDPISKTGRIQIPSATIGPISTFCLKQSSKSISAGVLKPRLFLGRVFRLQAM